MSIIRKLIIKEWLKAFLAALLILVLLVSIASLITGLLRTNVSSTDVIVNFFLDFPAVLIRTVPVSCLMASLFGLNRMMNRNELTAIFASGFSRANFLATIAGISALVALSLFIIAGYWQPFSRNFRDVLIEKPKRFKNLRSHGLRYSTRKTGKIWYKSKDYYFSFTAYDKEKKTLVDVDLYLFDKDYKLQQHVSALKAEHMIDNTWVFHQGTSYDQLHSQSFPKAAPFKNLSLILNEIPSDFDKIEADTSILTLGDLWTYIRKLSKSGINTSRYEIQFWSKISESLICILFALIASIAIFNPNRRSNSFGKIMVAVFAFVILYWLINSYLTELGKNSKLEPFLASFLIPFALIIAQGHIIYQNRRLRG